MKGFILIMATFLVWNILLVQLLIRLFEKLREDIKEELDEILEQEDSD